MSITKQNTPNIILVAVASILSAIVLLNQFSPFQADQFNQTILNNINSFSSYPSTRLDGTVTVKNGVYGRVFNQKGIFENDKRLGPNTSWKTNEAYNVSGHYYYRVSHGLYLIDSDATYQK